MSTHHSKAASPQPPSLPIPIGPFDPNGPSTCNTYSIYILYCHREEHENPENLRVHWKQDWHATGRKMKLTSDFPVSWASSRIPFSMANSPCFCTVLLSLMVLPRIQTYNLFTFKFLRKVSSAAGTSVTAELRTIVSGLDHFSSSKHK